ncbi:hypothetical protein RRG08_016575 [Elysia crispata]|uniref:Uncharacterized protein n=1 Tax=Elysia crispata TaxID=231223 RepID=A0AAE1E3W6_9GAST|nr:hypothetical protein RRG08_016575 [Elysia crispata]
MKSNKNSKTQLQHVYTTRDVILLECDASRAPSARRLRQASPKILYQALYIEVSIRFGLPLQSSCTTGLLLFNNYAKGFLVLTTG